MISFKPAVIVRTDPTVLLKRPICSLVCWSDTIALSYEDETGSMTSVTLIRIGIAWDSDKNTMFRNPTGWWNGGGSSPENAESASFSIVSIVLYCFCQQRSC